MTIEPPKSPITILEALKLHSEAKEPDKLDWQSFAGLDPKENPRLFYQDDYLIIYSHIKDTNHVKDIHIYPMSEDTAFDYWWQYEGIHPHSVDSEFELINWAYPEPKKKRTIFVHKLVFTLEADETESVYAEFTSPEPFVDDRIFDEIAEVLERLHGKLVKDWRNGNHPVHTWFRDGEEMGG